MNQIKYLLSRALSGYALLFPVLIVYFLLLVILHRKQTLLHIATSFVFIFYLFLIIAATGIGNTTAFSFAPEVILTPFRDIVIARRHFVLNIIAFVPFGFFLPLLYKRYSNIKIVAISGFLFSLCIELVQMFGWGVTELDDLMANTFGVCLGFYLYRLIKKAFHKDYSKPFQAVKIIDGIEMFLFSFFTFFIMALIQPLFGNNILAFH